MWLLFGYFPLNVRVTLGFRQAHNLKVVGSHPAPATNKTVPKPLSIWMAVFRRADFFVSQADAACRGAKSCFNKCRDTCLLKPRAGAGALVVHGLSGDVRGLIHEFHHF